MYHCYKYYNKVSVFLFRLSWYNPSVYLLRKRIYSLCLYFPRLIDELRLAIHFCICNQRKTFYIWLYVYHSEVTTGPGWNLRRTVTLDQDLKSCHRVYFQRRKPSHIRYLQYRKLWTEILAICSWCFLHHHRMKHLFHVKFIWGDQQGEIRGGLIITVKRMWQLFPTKLTKLTALRSYLFLAIYIYMYMIDDWCLMIVVYRQHETSGCR